MSLRKSFAWAFSQQFWLFAMHVVGSIVVARLLTPHEMGIFGLAVAAYALISSLREFGVGSYLIQQATLNDDKVRTAFGMWIIISWTLGLLLFGCRNYVADFYHAPGIGNVLALVSISLFVTPFGQPAQSLLTREMQFDVLHHIAVASTAVTVVTNIALAVAGLSYMALAWGMAVGTVVRSILLIVAHPTHLRMFPSFRYWREVLSFGGGLTATSLLSSIVSEGNRFMLGAFINPAAVGLFDRAIQIPTQVRDSLFAPVWRVLFPAFSRDIREGISIGPQLEKLVSVTTVVMWPAFLTTGILAQSITVALFGEKWRVAGQILPYFLLGQALVALLPPAYQILVPRGKVRRYFWLSLFATITSLSFAAVGAMYSLELFAILSVIGSALYTAAVYISIREFLEMPLRSFLRHYRNSCLIAVCSSLPAFICYFVYWQRVPFLALVVVALISPLMWILMIYAVKSPITYEISAALSQIVVIRNVSAKVLSRTKRG